MRPGTLLIAAAAAALVAVAVPQPTLAQTYPTQDVHFICAFAAGSGADIIVRYFSEKMRPLMGRSIIVENRVGAIGNLATEYVARSKPDGHVIYVTGASGVAANMHIFKNPSVDVGNALQVAATINKATMMLGVRADAPWNSAPELAAAMKLKGDKASYAIANPPRKCWVRSSRSERACSRSRWAIARVPTSSTISMAATSTTPFPTISRRWRRRAPAACAFSRSARRPACRVRRIFRL